MLMFLAKDETWTLNSGTVITVLVIIVLALAAWWLWRHRGR